ncbi:hypothetical protein B0H17DRAFT_1138578 [Mycena rosella]|uniref:Uncharacterized protein n=1 Tax=Mycena rosella TaxID=1033263 RepID=A0AAD7D627_MYCRO|nr:hypothetical protein B0H17DRAFT_1138578 [Mycena rosella]
MPSSPTTSSRRRVLLGASRSREQLPTAGPLSMDSALYSVSSRTSTSSSFGTTSKMSIETSQTSFSLSSVASSNNFKGENPTFVSDGDRLSSNSASNLAYLSPIDIFKRRLGASDSIYSPSRRNAFAPGIDCAPSADDGRTTWSVEVDRAPVRAQCQLISSLTLFGDNDQPIVTRVVGRGGVGSRPRGLAVVEPLESMPRRVEAPPPPPLPRAATRTPETPPVPVIYRPGGRSGAGSRPRKPKPQAETNSTSKDFKFSWKGKGRADANPHALTRTVTLDSTYSSLRFAPPAACSYQQPMNPDSYALPGGSTQLGSPPDRSAHRESNYDQFRRSSLLNDSDSSGFHREVWDSDDFRPAAYLSRPETSHSTQYPTPRARRRRFPSSPPITPKPTIYPRRSRRRLGRVRHAAHSFHAPYPQGRFVVEDTDDDDTLQYGREQMQTPTPCLRPETAGADAKQLESPFHALLIFVVEPWERNESLAGNELAQEWTGEWNHTDIQSVIHSLRHLRM